MSTSISRTREILQSFFPFVTSLIPPHFSVEVNDGVESCRVFVVGRHDPHEMLSLGRVLVRALTNSLEFRVRRNNSPDEEVILLLNV